MSSKIAIGLSLVTLLIGCAESDSTTPTGSDKKSGQPTSTNGNGESPLKPHSHVIAADTAYYTTGPQQGRPPDGTFKAGTQVNVLKNAGSYTLVRSVDGIEAYVAEDVLKAADGPEKKMTTEMSKIVEAGNEFSLDLYQQLRTQEGNLFFSPTSLSTALAMTYAGAEGTTETEMAETLHFEITQAQLHEGMNALQSFWKTPTKKKGYRLHLANRLWGQNGYDFLSEFLQITRTHYGAELARLDFATQTEKSRQTINAWIEDQTENKINELIPMGLLPSDSKLVLTNAVYFKGDWTEPFDKDRTKEEDFHLSANDKVKVPLMYQQDDFRYAAVDGLQILELPYGDKSLSMIVLLPQEVDGLGDLESKMTLDILEQWTGSLRSRKVRVYLPKFKMTSQFEMSETLKALGMISAFDPLTADFSGMTGGRDLFISAAIHKAFVDVNEEGTEAAAASGIVMAPTSARFEPKVPPVFRADHPFMFLIRDNRNGAILFLGRLTDPTR
jgi:serpin B